MKKQPEFELQKQVCKYLELQYKDVLFLSDTVASIKLTFPQQNRNKSIQKKGFKTPDLIIFEARRGYNGLLIELKVNSPFKKDGGLKKDEHLEGQQDTILNLNEKGYKACFSTGFEETKRLIDWYFS